MKGLSTSISAWLTLAYQTAATLDLISLYTSGNATIVEASATLVLPGVPNPLTGDTALWSALRLDRDFIQGVSESAPVGLGYCLNLGNNWCNIAYALTPDAENGRAAIAAPGARVRTHYKLNSVTNMWDQNIYINNQSVSNISTSQGQKGDIFYISVECAARPCAATPAHSWESISIILSAPNLHFKHFGSWKFGATGGNMTTADGGKTWTFSTLYVPVTTP
ncbi:hypothetical protein ONZ43_g5795 [Nemania bipapillata]|uniref:Uncharacterized protein n=1 Tax=Nemania bipapillata TaxID=110536 RepID=A0ACC2I6G2_9PEZI|nr:hypothetical protein ONZ43_g5795 [Nemania bipapillata]